MSRTYEDSINAAFISNVGYVLARAQDDGTDAHDYIDELIDLYESTIDSLPEPYPEYLDDSGGAY